MILSNSDIIVEERKKKNSKYKFSNLLSIIRVPVSSSVQHAKQTKCTAPKQ